MNFKKSKSNEAWTFIETLIVMAIVLILTSSVGFSAVKQIDKAKLVNCKTQIESFEMALDSFYLDLGFYPSTTMSLKVLWEKPSSDPSFENWNGPYISKSIPKDPWGNDYLYKSLNKKSYEIKSYGKDGISGGDGFDEDIIFKK